MMMMMMMMMYKAYEYTPLLFFLGRTPSLAV